MTSTPRPPLSDDLFLAAYQRHYTEIGHQLVRRESITAHVFTLLGTSFTMAVVSLTAGQWVHQPLIGLYGGSVAALLLPILLLFLIAKHEHADIRLGQLAWWIRTHFEPHLPAGTGWDTHRKLEFPDRPWLRHRRRHHALAQPKNLQLWAMRLLIGAIDGLALAVGAGTITATIFVGPWWTALAAVVGALLFLAAATATTLTFLITRHPREHNIGT